MGGLPAGRRRLGRLAAAAFCLWVTALCEPGACSSPSPARHLRRHGGAAAANASTTRSTTPLVPSSSYMAMPDGGGGGAPIDPLPGLPARSLRCFEDGQVYGCCEAALRLNPSGVVAVPPWAVDRYCGGACVSETEDVLNCVASALDGFAFYNGASVEDVRYALRRGCSHTTRRGDFNDLEPHLGDCPDIYGDDDGSDGYKAAAPLRLLAFLGGAWLLLLGP